MSLGSIFPKYEHNWKWMNKQREKNKCKYSIKIHKKSREILTNSRKKFQFYLTQEMFQIATNLFLPLKVDENQRYTNFTFFLYFSGFLLFF